MWFQFVIYLTEGLGGNLGAILIIASLPELDRNQQPPPRERLVPLATAA